MGVGLRWATGNDTRRETPAGPCGRPPGGIQLGFAPPRAGRPSMPKLTKDTLGVGFIGAGDISVLQGRAVQKCPGAKLVGLWNRGRDRARQRAAEFGCRDYDSPDALVNDPAVDAVFVLTNLETHLEYTKLALKAGKHVLVEKPVGVSVAEIERMKALADAKDLVCLPGHNYVYEQGMNRTRELVEGGDLGRIV